MNVIAEYPSAVNADSITGIKHNLITACCRGKREQAGNYKWRFENV
jgi:hypothetical protein